MNVDIIKVEPGETASISVFKLHDRLKDAVQKQFEGEKYRIKMNGKCMTLCFKKPVTMEKVAPLFTEIANEGFYIPYLEWKPVQKGKVMRDVLKLKISDEAVGGAGG